MKKTALMFGALAASSLFAAANEPSSFAATVEDFLATHPVAGMEHYSDFCRAVAAPAAPAEDGAALDRHRDADAGEFREVERRGDFGVGEEDSALAVVDEVLDALGGEVGEDGQVARDGCW